MHCTFGETNVSGPGAIAIRAASQNKNRPRPENNRSSIRTCPRSRVPCFRSRRQHPVSRKRERSELRQGLPGGGTVPLKTPSRSSLHRCTLRIGQKSWGGLHDGRRSGNDTFPRNRPPCTAPLRPHCCWRHTRCIRQGQPSQKTTPGPAPEPRPEIRADPYTPRTPK